MTRRQVQAVVRPGTGTRRSGLGFSFCDGISIRHDWFLMFLVFVMGFAASAVLHPLFLQFLKRYVKADKRESGR